jgi:hypothetical protein
VVSVCPPRGISLRFLWSETVNASEIYERMTFHMAIIVGGQREFRNGYKNSKESGRMLLMR